MLVHLFGAGGTVHADHVDAQWLQCRECSADFRAEQHGAGGLHGDVDHDGNCRAQFFKGHLCTQNSGLDLQQILTGLNE